MHEKIEKVKVIYLINEGRNLRAVESQYHRTNRGAVQTQTDRYKYHCVNVLNCETMTYSKVQERAIGEIVKITNHFGEDRWFTQNELKGIGYHTMEALVNKKHLKSQYFNNTDYYKISQAIIRYHNKHGGESAPCRSSKSIINGV